MYEIKGVLFQWECQQCSWIKRLTVTEESLGFKETEEKLIQRKGRLTKGQSLTTVQGDRASGLSSCDVQSINNHIC